MPLPDEIDQVSEVVEYLQEHPAVVTQSVDCQVSQRSFTDVTFHVKLKRARDTDDFA